MKVEAASPQAEENIIGQIAELQPDPDETRAEFLGRAAIAVEQSDSRVMSEKELGYLNGALPTWYFSTARIHNKTFGVARRLGPASPGQRAILGEHRSPRRVVAFESESRHLVLLASNALYGSDVKSAFEIEAANERLANRPAVSPPKPPSMGKIRGSGEKAELIEIPGAEDLHVTPSEVEALRLAAYGKSEAASQLVTSPEAVTKRLRSIVNRNDIDRTTMLRRALRGNLIDLQPLPAPTPQPLTELEVRTVSKHTFDTLDVMTDRMKLSSRRQAAKIWSDIYDKMGVVPSGADGSRTTQDRVRAYLVALRDAKIG